MCLWRPLTADNILSFSQHASDALLSISTAAMDFGEPALAAMVCDWRQQLMDIVTEHVRVSFLKSVASLRSLSLLMLSDDPNAIQPHKVSWVRRSGGLPHALLSVLLVAS